MMKIKGWYLTTLVFFLAGCHQKKEIIAVSFYGGFKEDTILMKYGNQIVFDSIISTNYSIVVAARVYFKGDFNKILSVKVNNTLYDSVIIIKDFNKVAIEVWNDSLIFGAIKKSVRY
jgi:hypothetical protein